MLSYNLAPVPWWYFRDQSGKPLANGSMRAYRNNNRSEFKNVYANEGGSVFYLQPIQFDAAGGAGPFYWASNENYYLEIYDSSGALVHTIADYNAPQDGGITPITTHIDFTNYIVDPQFQYAVENFGPPLTFTNAQISNGAWHFEKTNTSATDKIEFIEFGLGHSLPPSNPARFIRYECTGPGSSEVYKALEYRFPDVRSFENQQIAIALYGQASAAAPNVEIETKQYFGTGGSPSPTHFQPIVTANFTTSWEQRTGAIIVPSTLGKSRGTNSDDYFAIVFRYAQDSVARVDLTNFQLNLNNVPLPFNYMSRELTASGLVPNWYPMVASGRNRYLGTNSIGTAGWFAKESLEVPIGSVLMWLAPSLPTGFLECNGSGASTTAFPHLFSILGYNYGGAGATFNLPDFRGLFPRGWDNGRGLDPGRGLYTLQQFALQQHIHEVDVVSLYQGSPTGSDGPNSSGNGPWRTGNVVGANVATETRPVNLPAIFIIKAE